MTALDHLAFALLLLFSVTGRRVPAKLLRAPAMEAARLRRRIYLRTAAFWGLFALGITALWISNRRSLAELGMSDFAWALASLFIVVFARLWVPMPEKWPPLTEAERASPILALTPHDRRELRLWGLGTAFWALGEEVAYRGFTLAWLGAWLPKPAAILVAAALFAVAHLYQGRRGAIFSGGFALASTGVYLLFRSIYPCVALHFLWDLWSGYASYKRFEATAAAGDAAALSSRTPGAPVAGGAVGF